MARDGNEYTPCLDSVLSIANPTSPCSNMQNPSPDCYLYRPRSLQSRDTTLPSSKSFRVRLPVSREDLVPNITTLDSIVARQRLPKLRPFHVLSFSFNCVLGVASALILLLALLPNTIPYRPPIRPRLLIPRHLFLRFSLSQHQSLYTFIPQGNQNMEFLPRLRPRRSSSVDW